MREVAVAQEVEAASQRRYWVWALRLKSLVMLTPTMLERSWLNMALRGWAKGDSIA
jgi:hypothetical protein